MIQVPASRARAPAFSTHTARRRPVPSHCHRRLMMSAAPHAAAARLADLVVELFARYLGYLPAQNRKGGAPAPDGSPRSTP